MQLTNVINTHIADKALDMPLSLEGSDNVVDNSFVAATTLGSEHLVVIALAVGFTFKHMVPDDLLTVDTSSGQISGMD